MILINSDPLGGMSNAAKLRGFPGVLVGLVGGCTRGPISWRFGLATAM